MKPLQPKKKSDPSVTDEPLFRQCIKIEKSHKYALYKCFGDSFCVEDLGNEEYTEFLNRLPATECRYAVYNFPYRKEADKKQALIFIMWIPEGATRKSRTLFIKKKPWFTQKFFGINLYIDASSKGQLKQFRILQKAMGLA